MPHLWTSAATNDWALLPLENAAYALDADDTRCVDGAFRPATPPVLLVHVDDSDQSTWVLVAEPAADVRVNGAAVRLGLVALSDRDEIRIAGGPARFFSTERLAVVAPFPTEGARGRCPRCKEPIDAGTPAVRCPSCGVWHHASTEWPCWTYGPHCVLCPQDTALDAPFRWSPEELV